MSVVQDPAFGGVVNLLGTAAFQRISDATVMVVGLGGVGSWAVEALARSGVGHLVLVDRDDVCVTNINRQLGALRSSVSQPKGVVLANRIRDINPECRVTVENSFFNRTTAASIMDRHLDAVVDAIDGVAAKTLLIAECRRRKIPIVVSGAAGGRDDCAGVTVVDLAKTEQDPLLAFIRKKLRTKYGFPRGRAQFGVKCVYLAGGSGKVIGTASAACSAAVSGRSCNEGLGTLAHVTGTLGLLVAGEILKVLRAPVVPEEKK